MEVFYILFCHSGCKNTKNVYFILQDVVGVCFLGLVQTASIPLKNFEFISFCPGSPRVVHTWISKWGLFYSEQVHSKYFTGISFELSCRFFYVGIILNT
jgi:hypothetical protein